MSLLAEATKAETEANLEVVSLSAALAHAKTRLANATERREWLEEQKKMRVEKAKEKLASFDHLHVADVGRGLAAPWMGMAGDEGAVR